MPNVPVRIASFENAIVPRRPDPSPDPVNSLFVEHFVRFISRRRTFRGMLAGVLLVVATVHAGEGRARPHLRLEVVEPGVCTGLRVDSRVVPWIPLLGGAGTIADNASTTRRDGLERTDRFQVDAAGLRWTQTLKNLTHQPIGVGPTFAAIGGAGSAWTTPGLPLEIRFFPKQDVGVSLIVSPDDAIWSDSRRLDPGQAITFTALVRAHACDWRPGMAALVEAYPEYMNPPNPRVHQIVGGGSYSASQVVPDVEAALKMGFRVNWKASFDFACMGVFVAPSPLDVHTTWTDIRGHDSSIAKLAQYATAMKQSGFHVLNYFNVTEAGHRIQQPAPQRIAANDDDLWRNPNDWVHHAISNAVLEDPPGRFTYTNWEECVVVDPAEPKYRAHLLDQATRLVRDVPDADGVCIDRMDHLARINSKRDDGMSLHNGQPTGAWLLISWMQVMDDLGPIFHQADKVILGNPIGTYSLAAFRHLDGIYTEYWDEMEACAMLCMNKPLIVWSGPYDDAGMQKLLHYGAWPTCPMPGNDHCQGPDLKKEALLADYAPMFDALRGRRWALHARPIACDDAPAARLNLFVIPGGYLATVTGADIGRATIRLPSLPLPSGVEGLRAWSITPAGAWTPIPVKRRQSDWSVTTELGRGCAVVRLHWAWVEPFQPWSKELRSVDIRTTVSDAEIHATTDGTAVNASSPTWTAPTVPTDSLRLRAGIWKYGRQVGEEIAADFVKVH